VWERREMHTKFWSEIVKGKVQEEFLY